MNTKTATEQARSIYELSMIARQVQETVNQIEDLTERIDAATKAALWNEVARHSESLASANARLARYAGEARIRETLANALHVPEEYIGRANLGEDCSTEWFRTVTGA